ncbi:MAG: DUF402 domain-containing protein [Acidobacteria bacterium]|nr:DUF402 domain-containing protein [Acidobacteriota bacterium]
MSDSLLVLEASFQKEIQHPLLGTISPGTTSTEYFWADRWYSVFRFREPSGKLRNYYCNINTPPCIDGALLSYIDLDLDIIVASDFSYQLVDKDEFSLHSAYFKYTPDLLEHAHQATTELVFLIEQRLFPFDQEI